MKNVEFCGGKLRLRGELRRREWHYHECIGRHVRHRCEEEEVMLWLGLGGRLGVDLCRYLGLEVKN